MKNVFLLVYQFLFCRKLFYFFHKKLFAISLRGLGVLNYADPIFKGEQKLIDLIFKNNSRSIIFDVGANLGDYSKEIFYNNSLATVYAFEPHPKSFEQLKNINNDNFYPNNVAVGKVCGDVEFFDYLSNLGSAHSSVYKGVIEDVHQGQSVKMIVPQITLDEYCAKKNITSIDLLKIDTEGSELEVLLGAKNLLDNNAIKVIQFEFNEMNLISRVFIRDFVKLLNNYRFYRLLNDGLVPFDYQPTYEIFAFQNLVAVNHQIDEF